jgi:hypothetical protein
MMLSMLWGYPICNVKFKVEVLMTYNQIKIFLLELAQEPNHGTRLL